VTIHSEHPFLPPESGRDPARRFRSRLGGAVTLWTTGTADQPNDRAGLPVSSVLVAAGEPAHVVALLDPDASLVERLLETRTAVVQLLQWQHRHLADAFAGQAPAPGGAFRLAQWMQSPWGPVLDDASAWVGVRVQGGEPTAVGWSLLVDTVIEHVEIGEEQAPLVHRRGRYSRFPAGPG
jgi:flavin reductase (DIM6/NTAB) family NADH-FMN oxidoreductase RutF